MPGTSAAGARRAGSGERSRSTAAPSPRRQHRSGTRSREDRCATRRRQEERPPESRSSPSSGSARSARRRCRRGRTRRRARRHHRNRRLDHGGDPLRRQPVGPPRGQLTTTRLRRNVGLGGESSPLSGLHPFAQRRAIELAPAVEAPVVDEQLGCDDIDEVFSEIEINRRPRRVDDRRAEPYGTCRGPARIRRRRPGRGRRLRSVARRRVERR